MTCPEHLKTHDWYLPHQAWLHEQGDYSTHYDSSVKPRRANLRDANLSGANLRWADMRNSDLRNAKLSDANLSGAIGIRWVSISWNGHGQLGRMLTGVVIDGRIAFFCSCFRGSEDDLRHYINESHEVYRESRTRAMDIVLELIGKV